jgi:TRAP-type C4-dicarboxylate transport system permease small subunit
VASWLTFWSYDYFRYALRVWKESPTLYIPTFYAECAMFIGLVLMTVYAAWYLVKNVRRLFTQPRTRQGA